MKNALDRANEQRLRRLATSKDMSLHKYRSRTPSCLHYGMYFVLDSDTRALLHDGLIDLDHVEGFLRQS